MNRCPKIADSTHIRVRGTFPVTDRYAEIFAVRDRYAEIFPVTDRYVGIFPVTDRLLIFQVTAKGMLKPSYLRKGMLEYLHPVTDRYDKKIITFTGRWAEIFP